MTHAETFKQATGLAPTPKNISEVQRRLDIKPDGKLGPITAAVVASEWVRLFMPYASPAAIAGVLTLIRCPNQPRTLVQRDEDGAIAYRCVARWVARDGAERRAACSTLPMQVTSEASPKGHVAVVRPGDYRGEITRYKGHPAFRIGNAPCWRNLEGLPVVTAGDRAKSESMRAPAYPQCNDTGTYATGILFHAGPPIGFSIGCFTAPAETMLEIADDRPPGGWLIRLIDPHEAQ